MGLCVWLCLYVHARVFANLFLNVSMCMFLFHCCVHVPMLTCVHVFLFIGMSVRVYPVFVTVYVFLRVCLCKRDCTYVSASEPLWGGT
jgi:hypothetical protein